MRGRSVPDSMAITFFARYPVSTCLTFVSEQVVEFVQGTRCSIRISPTHCSRLMALVWRIKSWGLPRRASSTLNASKGLLVRRLESHRIADAWFAVSLDKKSLTTFGWSRFKSCRSSESTGVLTYASLSEDMENERFVRRSLMTYEIGEAIPHAAHGLTVPSKPKGLRTLRNLKHAHRQFVFRCNDSCPKPDPVTDRAQTHGRDCASIAPIADTRWDQC